MENENRPIDQGAYNRFEEYRNQPMSVGDWFVTILITAIPLVGLIMLFVWGFSSGTNVNKANWAKASLIWYAVGIGIAIIIMATVGAAVFSQY